MRSGYISSALSPVATLSTPNTALTGIRVYFKHLGTQGRADHRQLEAFIAVCEAGSVTAAAELGAHK